MNVESLIQLAIAVIMACSFWAAVKQLELLTKQLKNQQKDAEEQSNLLNQQLRCVSNHLEHQKDAL